MFAGFSKYNRNGPGKDTPEEKARKVIDWDDDGNVRISPNVEVKNLKDLDLKYLKLLKEMVEVAIYDKTALSKDGG